MDELSGIDRVVGPKQDNVFQEGGTRTTVVGKPNQSVCFHSGCVRRNEYANLKLDLPLCSSRRM
jgi:hypothetical protein